MPRRESSEVVPPSAVRIALLGGFVVRVGTRDVGEGDWPGLRAAQLVQLLSLARGHRLLRDQVVEALWPELGPEAGRANLRKAAHHARQALQRADAVALQGGEVILFPGVPVEVDAERFERLAEAALASRDRAACAEAAAAYAGELLPGARYEPWAEAARERCRARCLELLRLAEDWQRLADMDPGDEPAHRALMQQALDAGNRPAAIRWYGRLRTALQALGALPDERSERLYRQCLPQRGSPAPAFVGRQPELARVAALLQDDSDDSVCAWAVRGPAGIGKSAFGRETARMAQAAGWTVVALEATLPGRPFALVSAAVERLVLADRSLLEAVGAPARSVLAVLSPLAAPAAPLPGPLGRHQVIGALRRLLLAAARDGRVVVQVDDAHLLDEADADVMLHLAGSGRPVRVALALRPGAAQPALERGVARLAGDGRLSLIDLQPLPDEEAQALVAQALRAPPAGPVDEALVARIVGLAGGNAFAALELARSSELGQRLPASAREAISARLCDVGDDALAMLRRLALAGDELDTATVVALSGDSEAHAFAQLDLALREGVLVVAEGRYRFRHELVRQALVEEVPPHRRLAVHRDAARRLVGLEAEPAVIARHWLAGGCPGEARPWLLAAARNAIRLGAFADALRQLEPLLRLDPAHAETLRLRAEALDALGDRRAVAAYEAAAVAAGEPESHDLRAKGALAQVKGGDPKGALLAVRGLKPSSVEGRLAEALTLSGCAALGFGDPAAGTAKAAEARRLALQSGDSASLVIASWAQAAAAHARGELHSSVWADLHETQDVPHLALRVFDGHLCIMQRFLYGARPYSDVMAFGDAIAAEAQRLGAVRGQAFGVTLRGEAELLAGQLDAAEQHLALGGRLHREVGGATGEALSLQRRAELALHRGDTPRAARLLDEALDLARQTDIGFHLLDRIYGARVAMHADPARAMAMVEEAEEAVRGPLETCPGCRITFAVPAAIASARAGRLDAALRHERAVAFLADVVMRLPAWHAAHQEVRAELALAQGDGARAAQLFAAAGEGFAQAGQPLDATRCARLARQAGERALQSSR